MKEIKGSFPNPIQAPEDYVHALENMGIVEKATGLNHKKVILTGGRRTGLSLAVSIIKYLLELLSERDKKIEEIKTIVEKTLNMVDYKTYFKRDNKSIKQEGFKALQIILNVINNKESELNNHEK